MDSDGGRGRTSPGGQILNQALSGEASLGSKHLDLLLDMHGIEPAGTGKSAAVLPGAASVAAMPVGKAPRLSLLPLLPRGALLNREAALPSVPGDPATVQREWTGGGQWSTGGSDAAAPGVGGTGEHTAAVEDAALRGVAIPLLQFLRGNREWLVGGVAALALLIGVVKAFTRPS